MTILFLFHKLFKRTLLFAFTYIVCASCFSQKVSVDYFLKSFPNEPFIYLNKTEHSELKVVKNNLSVSKHVYTRILILKNNLSQIRTKKIRTTGFIKASNIRAKHYVFDGSGHKKKTITDIELKKEHNDGYTFYDGDQYYSVNFADAKDGDIIEIDYDEEYTEPRFFDLLFFSDYHHTIASQQSITYNPNEVSLLIKELNNQSLLIKKVTETKKGNTTIMWTADSIPALITEDYDPPFRYKSSYVLLSIINYTTATGTVAVSGTLENLYSWYTKLMKNVDISDDNALASITDSLTKDLKTEEEKVRAIFSWVQNKIAYLAYEDDLGGYIPREAILVVNRRFGDCKDMANLIVRMAQSKKLPVYHAWIGTRDIPYQFTDFPAPFCANHMIAAYLTDKDTVFLDATGKYQPFGVPTSMIQEKEAFIGLSKDKYAIVKVPVLAKEANYEQDSIVLEIKSKNKLEGVGYYKVAGHEKIRLLNYFDKKSYQLQKKYLREILQKGNNKFSLDTFYVSEQIPDKHMLIYYKFSINDYLTENQNIVFMNANFLKNYFDNLNAYTRKSSFDFTNTVLTKLYVNLKLGNTYKADYIPQNYTVGNDVLGFSQFYTKYDDKIIFSNTIYINRLEVTSNNFTQWNKVIDDYKKTKSNLLSIIKN